MIILIQKKENVRYAIEPWLNKEWAISKKGNPYMKIKDRLFTLYQRSDGKYVIYTEPKIRTIFKSFYDAKIAIFDLLDEM